MQALTAGRPPERNMPKISLRAPVVTPPGTSYTEEQKRRRRILLNSLEKRKNSFDVSAGKAARGEAFSILPEWDMKNEKEVLREWPDINTYWESLEALARTTLKWPPQMPHGPGNQEKRPEFAAARSTQQTSETYKIATGDCLRLYRGVSDRKQLMMPQKTQDPRQQPKTAAQPSNQRHDILKILYPHSKEQTPTPKPRPEPSQEEVQDKPRGSGRAVTPSLKIKVEKDALPTNTPTAPASMLRKKEKPPKRRFEHSLVSERGHRERSWDSRPTKIPRLPSPLRSPRPTYISSFDSSRRRYYKETGQDRGRQAWRREHDVDTIHYRPSRDSYKAAQHWPPDSRDRNFSPGYERYRLAREYEERALKEREYEERYHQEREREWRREDEFRIKVEYEKEGRDIPQQEDSYRRRTPSLDRYGSSRPHDREHYRARSPGRATGTCHNCRKSGHFAVECPEEIMCRNCHGRGHRDFECKKPKVHGALPMRSRKGVPLYKN